MVKYDLLIKDGLLIDPSQGIKAKMDVAILEGKVAELKEGIDPSNSRHLLDAKGLIVTPGLIDLHTHVYYLLGHWSCDTLEVDSTSLSKGVTTVLDAGSIYPEDVDAFRYYIANRSRTRVYALLCMRRQGGRYAEAVKANRDLVIGIKWHHGPPEEDAATLSMARDAADWGECILMCEPYGLELKTILGRLYKGDVLTHSFHPPPRKGLLDENGKVLPEVWEAVNRGVYLDQGHGRSGFSFQVAEKCLEQGLLPFTISTDLHKRCLRGPVYDMPTTMSKWLALGMPLEEVVKRSTWNPAIVLRKEDEIGTLKIGACGDVACFKVLEGTFSFLDSVGETRRGRYKLEAIHVIRAGEVVF